MNNIAQSIACVAASTLGESELTTHLRELFTDIYERNAWGDKESRSGPGSAAAETVEIRRWLPTILANLQCNSLLDAPCGDAYWIADIVEGLPRYIGVDIVEGLVAENRLRHPRLAFEQADITRDLLPDADAILCRDCLNHFAFADIWSTLKNFARTNVRYLLMTSFTAPRANLDIATGEWRPLNLVEAPFHFPAPVYQQEERCSIGNGQYRDKALCVWSMTDIRVVANRETEY